MFERPKVVVAALLALFVAGCSSREGYVERRIDEARRFAERREYERAHGVLDEALKMAPGELDLLAEKADVFMRGHEFDEAALWYARAAEADPDSWKALAGRWAAELEAEPDDEVVRDRIRAEADLILAATPDGLTNLTAAVRAHQLLDIEDEIDEARTRLLTLYPDSELASDLIKEELDEIGVERDDERRLEMADEFLAAHPVSKWRPRAARLKLITLRRLDRFDDVLAVGRRWAEEHPDDPEVLNIVASAFVSCGIAADEAAGLARRAVEIDSATGGGEHSAEYAITAARALVLAGDFASAHDTATRALATLEIGPDDEETGAVHHFTLGQALDGLGLHERAFDEYLAAVIVGGRKNHWPARADTALGALFEGEFKAAAETTLLGFARERVGYGGPVFTDVTVEAGLEGRRESRIAWGDYNADGYDDLLLAGRVLLANDRNGGFVDVTESAGIGGTGTNGGVWADIDNDGDLDFYATSGATSGERTDRLWVNSGDGTFEDRTEAAGGMTDLYTTEGAAWGDIEGDGFVDLYLASYERPRDEVFEDYGVGYPDVLYRNLGGGTFVDVAEASGIEPPFGEDLSGRGVNWGDYDNDGDLDIYVSNYRLQENLLWRNDGDGTFTNVAPGLGVSGRETDGWWGHTIGSEWGDYDNDGDLDLVCANLAHPRYIEVSDMSMLYRNDLDDGGAFEERRARAGIKYAETHSDPAWGDVDADGDLDLFMTSIYPDCATFLYRNDGRGGFQDITWLAGVRSQNGWGAAMSDYDRDGDLDVAVASGDGFRLFRNDGLAGSGGRGRHHWLAVRAVGTRSNAAGIGARVCVRSGGGAQIREVQGGKGTTSQHSLVAFFGLGRDSRPVEVEVRFLGGGTVTLRDVEVDDLVTIVEPN